MLCLGNWLCWLTFGVLLVAEVRSQRIEIVEDSDY